MSVFQKLSAWRGALGLAAACLLVAWPAGATEPSADPPPVAEEKPAGPDEALKPFLGTWLMEEEITQEAGADTIPIQRYILIRWHRERFQIKTFDYLPRYKARNMESNWHGTIAIDQWNQAKQTFTPMPDSTISVGLSGTNGVGPRAKRSTWWAAGSLQLMPDDENGPQLRFHTFKGFAPSSTGNAWMPFDRTYHLVSRDIDPKQARPAGR